MKISIITAVALNGVIGKDNNLPWSLPNDTQYLKEKVSKYPAIMGRKSFEAEDAVLSGYKNVVLSRNPELQVPPKVKVCADIEKAIRLLKDEPMLFILGGESIYQATLPVADYLYFTRVYAKPEGDTYFPEVNWKEWRLLKEDRCTPNAEHAHAYSFLVFERIR